MSPDFWNPSFGKEGIMSQETLSMSAKERMHRTNRKRRAMFGEMLQIDGSNYAWFEERGPKTTLMVFI
jgi:hypothetical protein